MKVEVITLYQFSSKSKQLLMLDGKPICLTRGKKTMNDLVSFLMTGEPIPKDGKIRRLLEREKKKCK